MRRDDVNYSAYRMADGKRSLGEWSQELTDFGPVDLGLSFSVPLGSSGPTTPLYNTLYNQVVSSDNFSRSLNKNDESMNDRDCQCNIQDCSGECQGSARPQSHLYPKLVVCEDVDESGLNVMSRLPYPSNENDSSVSITLVNAETWQSLGRIGNEMLINKLGRRMFPEVFLSVKGLNPHARYYAFLDFVCQERRKFSFSKKTKSWTGGNENLNMNPSTRLFMHPNSPSYGSYWNGHTVHFQDVKLSNSDNCKDRIISICGMYTYTCRVHFVPCKGQIDWPNRISKTLPETTFYAVTCHKSEELKRLRGSLNPRSMYARCVQSSLDIKPVPRESRSMLSAKATPRRDSRRATPSNEKSVLKRKADETESSNLEIMDKLPNFSKSFVRGKGHESVTSRWLRSSEMLTYTDDSPTSVSGSDSFNLDETDESLPVINTDFVDSVVPRQVEVYSEESSPETFNVNVKMEPPDIVADNIKKEMPDIVGDDDPPALESFYSDPVNYGAPVLTPCNDGVGREYPADPLLGQTFQSYDGRYTSLPQCSNMSNAYSHMDARLERYLMGDGEVMAPQHEMSPCVSYREYEKPDSNFAQSSWGELSRFAAPDGVTSTYYSSANSADHNQPFNFHNVMYTRDEYVQGCSTQFSRHMMANPRNSTDCQVEESNVSDLFPSEYDRNFEAPNISFPSVDSCYRFLSGDDETVSRYDACRITPKFAQSDDHLMEYSDSVGVEIKKEYLS